MFFKGCTGYWYGYIYYYFLIIYFLEIGKKKLSYHIYKYNKCNIYLYIKYIIVIIIYIKSIKHSDTISSVIVQSASVPWENIRLLLRATYVA